MDKQTFSQARARLQKTQKELAALLGVSLKAVQSYEQGWRTIPLHVERQIYFLLVNQRSRNNRQKRRECWKEKQCGMKKQCPAWEFQAGHLCWFLNGTQCECTAEKDLRDKMDICRECDILASLL